MFSSVQLNFSFFFFQAVLTTKVNSIGFGGNGKNSGMVHFNDKIIPRIALLRWCVLFSITENSEAELFYNITKYFKSRSGSKEKLYKSGSRSCQSICCRKTFLSPYFQPCSLKRFRIQECDTNPPDPHSQH